MAALLASLAGDVFLMLQSFFIPGLVSFLIAHLCYLALFQRSVGWFPGSRWQWLPLLVGVGMYAFLWTGGLPPALRLPVAAYVLVIALMAAQALGRAMVLRTPEAMLALANSQVELKDTKGARRTLDQLVKQYPGTEAATAGSERLARLR